MKLTSDDIKAFIVGVVSSITAVIVWDFYKQKAKILEHSEQELMKEVKSAVLELKKHISETNGKTIS
jgi:hypothetical protein